MPSLNFKARFAPDVVAGIKTQTIRAPRKDGRPHCIPGDPLHLFTGMRTKYCRRLGKGICTERRQIWIEYGRVIVDGQPIKDDDAFARADGFANAMQLYDFFQEEHGLPFEGSLIKWNLQWKAQP